MAGPVDDFIKTAAYWLQRAEEARRQATLINDPTARASLHGVATSYEKLAKYADARVELKAGD
jgi:hypothetical protein